MFGLDRRDIPGIMALAGLAGIVIAPIIVAQHSTIGGLITSFVFAIFAVGIAMVLPQYSYGRQLAWFAAILCVVAASVTFNTAYPDQWWFTVPALFASAAVGFFVWLYKDNEADIFYLSPWFVAPTFASFFAILITFAVFAGPEKIR